MDVPRHVPSFDVLIGTSLRTYLYLPFKDCGGVVKMGRLVQSYITACRHGSGVALFFFGLGDDLIELSQFLRKIRLTPYSERVSLFY